MLSALFHNIAHLLSYQPDSPMLFSSGLFWGIFLVFLPLYALLRNRHWQMVVFVVAFSLFFYYKSSGWFFLLLIFTSLVDWMLSRRLSRVASPAGRKIDRKSVV